MGLLWSCMDGHPSPEEWNLLSEEDEELEYLYGEELIDADRTLAKQKLSKWGSRVILFLFIIHLVVMCISFSIYLSLKDETVIFAGEDKEEADINSNVLFSCVLPALTFKYRGSDLVYCNETLHCPRGFECNGNSTYIHCSNRKLSCKNMRSCLALITGWQNSIPSVASYISTPLRLKHPKNFVFHLIFLIVGFVIIPCMAYLFQDIGKRYPTSANSIFSSSAVRQKFTFGWLVVAGLLLCLPGFLIQINLPKTSSLRQAADADCFDNQLEIVQFVQHKQAFAGIWVLEPH